MAMFRPRQLHIESEAIASAGKVSGLQDSKRSKRERTRLHTEKHQLTSIATSYDVAICLALLHISLFALKAIS